MKLKRALTAITTLALVVPSQAFAAEFDPSEEFKLNPWISIHLGPLDMSINKAVVYLLLDKLHRRLGGKRPAAEEAEPPPQIAAPLA